MNIRQRLLALSGILVIVALAVGSLLLAGLIGNRGGGTTDTGVAIQNVLLLDPPRASGQESFEVGPQIGKLAPDFEISDFDGKRHKLSEFRGKVVYMNFWFTGCVPCLVELPDIQTLLNRHADDLVVIAVNRRDRLDRARDYLRDLPRTDGGTGVSFTVNGMDPNDTLYRTFKALGQPASFFIDATGLVTGVDNGQISLDVMEQELAKARAASGG